MTKIHYIKKHHHFIPFTLENATSITTRTLNLLKKIHKFNYDWYKWYQLLLLFSLTVLLGSLLLLTLNFWLFEQRFANRVYPGVYIKNIDVDLPLKNYEFSKELLTLELGLK